MTRLKFNGTLELDGAEGSALELDKDQFVRTIEQLNQEHGQQVFYTIEHGGTIHDMIHSPRIFSVEDVIASHALCNDSSVQDASRVRTHIWGRNARSAPVYLFSQGSIEFEMLRKCTFTTSPQNTTQNDDLIISQDRHHCQKPR
jgi:hypothetical protein